MTDAWPNHKVLELWQTIAHELDVPVDEKFGAALWTVFSNNQRVIDSDGYVVDVGTFRYAGGMIATLCGGDYMDYYMSDYREDASFVTRIRDLLRSHGFTLIEWDAWERGCVDGTYKVPPSWAEFLRD